MIVITGAEDFDSLAGAVLGPGGWVEVTRHAVTRFADALADAGTGATVNPARPAPELVLALLPSMLASIYRFENRTMGINYGLDRVRFLGAASSRVRARCCFASVSRIAPAGVHVVVDITVESPGRAVCEVEMLQRHYFAV